MGQTVDATAILARNTLPGDATLDATVDFNDLVKLAQNYNTIGGKTWAQGDFTGDGNVDFNDLVILAQRYNTALPAGAATPVAIAGAAPMPPLASVIAQLGGTTSTTNPAASTGTAPKLVAMPVPKPALKPAPKPVVTQKARVAPKLAPPRPAPPKPGVFAATRIKHSSDLFA